MNVREIFGLNVNTGGGAKRMLQSIMYNMHIWNFLFAHIIMHQILVDFKNNKWNSIKRIRRRNIVLFLHIKPVCME